MRTICVPSKTLCRPNLMVANGDIWFFTERDWNQECCHGNGIVGVIQFLLRCTLLVPSLKNATLMFLELFSIECCAVFVEPSTPKRKKDIPKRKTTFFLTMKNLSNKQQLFCYCIGALKPNFSFNSARNLMRRSMPYVNIRILCACLVMRRYLIQFPMQYN